MKGQVNINMAKESKKNQKNEEVVDNFHLAEIIRRSTERLDAIVGLYDAMISQAEAEGMQDNMEDMKILLYEAAISPVEDLREAVKLIMDGKIAIREGM